MTIGFYYHDRLRRTPSGRPTRHGPFWCSLRRNFWFFPLGEWVGLPDRLIKRFKHHMGFILATGREGSNIVVHVGS